jgi:hypothetical protein
MAAWILVGDVRSRPARARLVPLHLGAGRAAPAPRSLLLTGQRLRAALEELVPPGAIEGLRDAVLGDPPPHRAVAAEARQHDRHLLLGRPCPIRRLLAQPDSFSIERPIRPAITNGRSWSQLASAIGREIEPEIGARVVQRLADRTGGGVELDG